MGNRMVILFVLVLLLITGCTSNVTTSNEEMKNLSNELNQLTAQLKNQEEEIVVLKKKVDFLNEIQDYLMKEVATRTSLNAHIIKHLPVVVSKQGFIKEIVGNDNQYFMIDFVEMGGAGADFYIKNDKEEYVKVLVDNEVVIYVLDYTDMSHTYTSIDYFNQALQKYQHPRIFNLYFIDDRLIQVIEQYIP